MRCKFWYDSGLYFWMFFFVLAHYVLAATDYPIDRETFSRLLVRPTCRFLKLYVVMIHSLVPSYPTAPLLPNITMRFYQHHLPIINSLVSTGTMEVERDGFPPPPVRMPRMPSSSDDENESLLQTKPTIYHPQNNTRQPENTTNGRKYGSS